MQGVITFFGFWCLKLAIRWAAFDWKRYDQIDFANLPLMILVTTALSVVLLPAMNAYSRFNERQADLYAWTSLGSVRAFCSAMEKLAAQNLSEREPSRIVEILFHSHPCDRPPHESRAGLGELASRKPLTTQGRKIQFQGEHPIANARDRRAIAIHAAAAACPVVHRVAGISADFADRMYAAL